MTFLRGVSEVKGYYYYHKKMGGGVYPLLLELQANEHRQTPAFQMNFTTLTHRVPFEESIRLYETLCGIAPSPRLAQVMTAEIGERIEAIAEEEREQIRALESQGKFESPNTPDRLYISTDMTAYQTDKKDEKLDKMLWKMAKVGVIYDEKKDTACTYPEDRQWKNGWRRGETTYVGSMRETMEDIGQKLYSEALARGLNNTKDSVFIADGAECNWTLAELLFPDSEQVLDWGHAAGYLTKSGAALYGDGSAKMRAYYDEMETLLWNGKVIESIASIEKRYNAMKNSLSEQRSEDIRKTILYYENNKSRMRYNEYRARGIDIGSGSIESACRQVVGMRMKNCCMFWGERTSASVLAIRTADLSGKYRSYWDKMLAKAA